MSAGTSAPYSRRVMRRPAAKWRVALALAGLAAWPGCASYQAYQIRFAEPDYTVTSEYYARSPRRVAVLPFATRSPKPEYLEKAQVCRVAFYQQFSVRDFEDVEMQALDRKLLPPKGGDSHRRLRQFSNAIRKLDVVGVTSFLDWKSMTGPNDRGIATFRAWIQTAYEDLEADAYVLGVVRGYGRLYAVLFSSVGLETHVEMRATRDDALLWSSDFKTRNIALPITFDPLDIPFLLYDIWENSRGESLDGLAFKTYRAVVRTLPPERAKGGVYVRADRKKTRLFRHPTIWAFWPRPYVKAGTRLRLLQEKRGWYQCERPDGKVRWMLRRDGTLVDESGNPLKKSDPLGDLWKPES